MNTYLFVFFGSLLLAILVIPLVLFVARSLNIYDYPHARKVHAEAIPRFGGVAIFLASVIITLPVLLLNNTIGQAFRTNQRELGALLGAAALIFAMGLIDDLCHLRVRYKFLAQLFAALIVCGFGVRIEAVAVEGLFSLNLGFWSWPLTLLWIIGVTNAVNFIDGLDGLAGGIAAITCVVIALLAIISGQVVLAVLMLALLGSLIGFLAFNINPARIFMGDCGSLFLGFMLATASVHCASKSATLVALALPVLALGVPIFDILFSMLRRVLERRSIFSADRSHIHHRLLDMGLHHRQVVIVIYLVTLIAAGLGMFMMVARGGAIVAVFVAVLVLLALVFRIVGAIRLQESLARLKENYRITRTQRHYRYEFDQAQLLLRNVNTFEDWWQAVCGSAELLGLVTVTLSMTRRDGTESTQLWRNEKLTPKLTELIESNIPLPQRREGENLRLNFTGCVGDSLENAGHQSALFTRLIDEYTLKP